MSLTLLLSLVIIIIIIIQNLGYSIDFGEHSDSELYEMLSSHVEAYTVLEKVGIRTLLQQRF